MDIFEGPSYLLSKIGDGFFLLEVCEDFEKGLMEREHLLEGEGMLFSYPNKTNVSYHMKGCKIPLDIIFVSDNKIKKIHHNCNPCEDGECVNYEDLDVDTVIELNGGTCESNNINEGLIFKLI